MWWFVRVGCGVSRGWLVGCGVRRGITVGWCVGWGVSVGWWCRVVMRCCVFIFIVIIEQRCSYGHGKRSRSDRSHCCSGWHGCWWHQSWWLGFIHWFVLVLMFVLVQWLLVHVVLDCSLVIAQYCSEVVVKMVDSWCGPWQYWDIISNVPLIKHPSLLMKIMGKVQCVQKLLVLVFIWFSQL